MVRTATLAKPYYQNQGVTIYQGDCRDILPGLPDVDLVLTDPPYGIGFQYASYEDTLEGWKDLYAGLIAWSKLHAGMLITPVGEREQLPWIYQTNPPDWMICWYKGSPGHRSYIGFNDWEPLLVYGKTPGTQMHDYFYAQPETTANGHPCPKPVRWAAWLIERASRPEHTVLDPFMGSGTTLVAAKQLGRKAIGIELEPKYCDIAISRLQQSAMLF